MARKPSVSTAATASPDADTRTCGKCGGLAVRELEVDYVYGLKSLFFHCLNCGRSVSAGPVTPVVDPGPERYDPTLAASKKRRRAHARTQR